MGERSESSSLGLSQYRYRRVGPDKVNHPITHNRLIGRRRIGNGLDVI
jgi:hypothetical protein